MSASRHNSFIKNNIYGIKAETEAEGLSFNDIFCLKTWCCVHEKPLYVKIGGCEAVSDIFMCQEIGVEGIICPMIESPFAAHKFLTAVNDVYNGVNLPRIIINLESKQGLENLDDIMKVVKHQIENINIGRTDLSASYFNPERTPNSPFIMEKVKEIITKVLKYEIPVTLGGSVDKRTLEVISEDDFFKKNLTRIETRNIMFDINSAHEALSAIKEIEMEFILRRKILLDNKNKKNIARLNVLENRL